MELVAPTPPYQAQRERAPHDPGVHNELPGRNLPKRQPRPAEQRGAAKGLNVSTRQVQLQVQLRFGQASLQRIRFARRAHSELAQLGHAPVNRATATKRTPRKPETERRPNAREQATSERVVVDRLLDAVEKRLPQLGQRE